MHMAGGGGATGAAVVRPFAEIGQYLRVISEDQPVAALCKFMEVEQAFFGGQAFDKSKVGFTVLHAVFALGEFTFHRKAHINNAPLVAEGINDGKRVDFLEDARVLA